MDVYASWNGATEVATWEILGGSSAATLVPVGRAPRSGFETRAPVSDRTLYVAVRALDSAGQVISTSPRVAVRRTG
jgi:hypothetical protein